MRNNVGMKRKMLINIKMLDGEGDTKTEI